MYRRNGEEPVELPAYWPKFDDPHYDPKMLGLGALFGAVLILAFTIPIGMLVSNAYVAIGLIAAMWLMLVVAQVAGWYRYIFLIRPLKARMKILAANAEASRLRSEEANANSEAVQAAFHDYLEAMREGQEVLKTIWDRSIQLEDRKSQIRAHQDFNRAQKSRADEPDTATRMKLQANAMRRETRHIRNRFNV